VKWTAVWSRIARLRIIVYADFIDPFCYVGYGSRSSKTGCKKSLIERIYQAYLSDKKDIGKPGKTYFGALSENAWNGIVKETTEPSVQ